MKKLNSIKFKSLLIVATIAVLALLQSCKRDLEQIKPKQVQHTQPSKTNELSVSENFKWQTSNTVHFEINPSKTGVLLIQGENAEVFHKAIVKAGNTYSASLTVQNKYKNIYVYLNGNREKFTLADNIHIKSNLN